MNGLWARLSLWQMCEGVLEGFLEEGTWELSQVLWTGW